MQEPCSSPCRPSAATGGQTQQARLGASLLAVAICGLATESSLWISSLSVMGAETSNLHADIYTQALNLGIFLWMVNPAFSVSPLLFICIAIKAITKPVVSQGERSLPLGSFYSPKLLSPACTVLPWTCKNNKCHFRFSIQVNIKEFPSCWKLALTLCTLVPIRCRKDNASHQSIVKQKMCGDVHVWLFFFIDYSAMFLQK